MQIQATDSSIAVILEPAEARAILNRIDGVYSAQNASVSTFAAGLREWVDGPEDDDTEETV